MTRFCCGLDSLPKGNKPEMKLPKRTKYVVVAPKCAREKGGGGNVSIFTSIVRGTLPSGNDWSLLMINEKITRIYLLIIRWLLLAEHSLMHMTMTAVMFDQVMV